MASREIRAAVAMMATLGYGGLCGWNFAIHTAHWRRVMGFWGICLVIGVFVAMVTLDGMIERAIMMGALGIAIAATGVGAVVLFFLFLLRLANLANRIDTFINRLPYMATSGIVYLGAWYVPQRLQSHAASWPVPHWAAPWLVGLGGVLLVLLIAGFCRLFGIRPATAILETFAWGWYCVFFIILMVAGDYAD